MPGCARVNDTINTGHGCDTTATIIVGSNNVFVNGRSATFQGADISSHTITNPAPPPAPPCIPHPGQKVNRGSSTVKVNGKAMARIGDSADLGSVTGGSTNVFAGG
tara:strand:- start:607 stop:924 length:318 start_codon:yes stop_codon:yes gene_type:complete